MSEDASKAVDEVQLRAAVLAAAASLGPRPDVLAIRAGYRFKDGYITDERAIVVAVPTKLAMETLEALNVPALPSQFDGIPIDVTSASVVDVLPTGLGLAAAAPARGHNYKPRTAARFQLTPIKGRVRAVIHCGPDCGWPQLRAFLERSRRRLTIGMYEFTAPHVVDVGVNVASRLDEMTLVVQKGQNISGDVKADDIPDEETVEKLSAVLGENLNHAWATYRFVAKNLVNPKGVFDSHYHIKVAVRDGEELWLSSGSWQSSNQPPIDALNEDGNDPSPLSKYNREWHAIIAHAGLAAIYEAHLRQDHADALATALPDSLQLLPEIEFWVADPALSVLEKADREARYFEPLVLDREVEIVPLLSPDNYAEQVLDLIENATRTIYFQNQSLKIQPSRPEPYERLLRALLRKQQDGLDVRIIFRSFGADDRLDLEAIKDYGFDVSAVRWLKNCHTKGIIIDSCVALLGSHNWTNAGTCFNRDASLVFRDQQIAQYLEQVFLYDWSRSVRPRIDERLPPPRLARSDEKLAPPGMIKVRLADLDLS